MKTHSQGFTLIEMVIYIALLGIVLLGTLQSGYPILAHMQNLDTRISRDMEVLFVFQKISWVLSQSKTLILPQKNTSGNDLSLETYTGETYHFRLENGYIEMSTDGVLFIPLTSSRVTVENFIVTHHSVAPAHLEISLTVDGILYGPLERYTIPL